MFGDRALVKNYTTLFIFKWCPGCFLLLIFDLSIYYKLEGYFLKYFKAMASNAWQFAR